MTSASELFTARRAARGARLSDPDPEPDPHADALRDPHGLAGQRRRRGCRPRRQVDAAGDVRQHLHTGAPPPRRRGSYTVRSLPMLSPPPGSSSLPSLLLDYCRIACVVVGSDQILSYLDNNNIGDSAARKNRLDRLVFRTNERLPGAVLQAQARVLERLRSISLGSSASRPSISLDEFSASDVFRLIDFRNRETRHQANGSNSSYHLSSESDEERPTISSANFHKSSGLSKAAFLRLQIEIFEASKDDNREPSPECSICLDGFYDGDELIRLRCGHSLYSMHLAMRVVEHELLSVNCVCFIYQNSVVTFL
ncbi:hypothetical protein HU200_048442 [Digitaria exilis]|uniref:RING-type domain-containing protein n=1 Tax=Digitaria exilis TaxID=1010633 RepID=A0A835ASL2_9POAL|nr:hypothetical protein HU200_048442 [Digitaria exilis]